MNEKIEFKIGQEYENVKGVYTVVSVSGDSIVIQWENGKQVTTTMDLQRRIIERMRWEKEERDKKKIREQKGETRTRSTFGYESEFIGLKESDFKNNVDGTTWRSRMCLGGAVTKRFYSNSYDFDSWAVYRMPAVHWQDIKHRERDDTWLQAKFFVQVDENHLYYGFYIERSDNPADVKDDWDRFISWLKDAENENWLNDIAREHNLSIYDLDANGFGGTIQSLNGEWIRHIEADIEKILSLCSFLDTLPKNGWIDLHIAKMVNKNEVIKKGKDIADDISSLFEILIPLYKASTARAN